MGKMTEGIDHKDHKWWQSTRQANGIQADVMIPSGSCMCISGAFLFVWIDNFFIEQSSDVLVDLLLYFFGGRGYFHLYQAYKHISN